jgi:hypothetical protein
MAKFLMAIGLAIFLIGALVYFFPNAFSWFGRLPGDVRIKGEHGAFFFPITTMIIISVVLSLLFHLLRR